MDEWYLCRMELPPNFYKGRIVEEMLMTDLLPVMGIPMILLICYFLTDISYVEDLL